ncbi:hypothetical protein ACFQZZ_05140 [Nocardia sp. GCM10030253]|uniref:hypothetical protein n=1 Tax=Nocardia sp. GCM10030253 TaxID=3273404 RepID=UPI00363312E9
MVELSLRWHLAQIGEPKSTAGMRIPGDFQSRPPSGRLRDLMKAMRSPKPEQWTKTNQGVFSNKDWTEECQGVTHDQFYWYVSSNHAGKQRVYRLSPDGDVVDHVKLAGNGSEHLGHIDYHDGRIYCAMEDPADPPKIVVIDTPPFTGWRSVALVGESGGAPPQTRCAWCAMNPWNGLLYSWNGTRSKHADRLIAYRLDSDGARFVHVKEADIKLPEPLLFVQGAVFSKNGHVLLARNAPASLEASLLGDTSDIRCYSVLNGTYFGRLVIPKGSGWPDLEEVEGLTIWEGREFDGVTTHVHLILLDNDIHNDDDVYFKHYHVPLSDDL